jgi:putative DNA primase/helicase
MEGAFDALFREMPFVDGPSRSAAASLLLTALLRPLLRSAPMHLVDAAAPGTGKSKLAEAAALIATGGEPTTVIWSGRPEEDEKRIGSALRAADPFVLFDNVEHPLGGGQLAAALTQDPVNIRVLGQSELMTLGTRVMVAATGNNIAVAGDVGRRCVKARLDARTPEPEKRRFDWDPVKVARERRRELATQLLGAVAAYVRAGRPSDPPALGSFEAWTVVRGTLLWLGWDDPAETVADVKATDHSRAAEAEALATLNLAFDQGDGEGGPFTASDLERFMDPSDHLARPDDPLGAQLLEGKEAVAGHLLDGATSRQWMARRLKERDGLAAGEYYLEAGGRRTTSFRVYEP